MRLINFKWISISLGRWYVRYEILLKLGRRDEAYGLVAPAATYGSTRPSLPLPSSGSVPGWVVAVG